MAAKGVSGIAGGESGAAPAAVIHPLVQISRLMAVNAAPFRSAPPTGYQRGIDYYSAAALPRVISTAAQQFHRAHGRFPNIVQPQRFTDKIFWSKFFRLMKVPETGNKLATASFIPESAKELIECPAIVWHSTEAHIPRGGEIEPGTYYLKANLGSDRYRRVTYPIADDEAERLDAEFASHLSTDYNLWRGEWWYHTFERAILLERAVGTQENSTSWNFLVIGGEVARASAYQKLADGSVQKTHFSADFEPLPALGDAPPARVDLPSGEARERLIAAARAIGGPLRFVRVDMLLDDDERPYLGEVTFTPGNGVAPIADDLDFKFGALWDLRQEPV